MTGTGRRRRRRTIRAVIGGVATLLAVGIAGVAAAGVGATNGSDSGQAHSDLPPATAKVTRQTLLDTQSQDGTLGYGATKKAASRLAGTVTSLPAVGAKVQRGEVFYRVDNTPVVLLYGTLPAYRALALNTKGADVKQFEQNLYALGYRGFTVDDTYSDTTVTAVKKWQGALGLEKTGVVDLGRVVYSSSEVRVDAVTAVVGDASAPGAELFAYTGTSRVITAALKVADQRLAEIGAAVSVKLPSGKTTPGKIVNSETVITPAEGQNPAATKIEVTVTVDDETALAGLGPATVSVNFTASKRENVLTVPVAALLALAEGGYGVQVVDGGSTRIVVVQTGLFASGRVEVSGDGLTEGTTVGVPS